MALTCIDPYLLKGKTVVLTGGFVDDDYRKEYQDAVTNCGGALQFDVRPNTDIVVWEPAFFGETIKLKQAREYNGMGADILILTAEEFAALLAGEDVRPTLVQNSNNIDHIARYAVSVNEERVERHLKTHDITTESNRAMLFALLKKYNRTSLTKQREWCELVAQTPNLDYGIYKAAAQYYMRVAEYDKAEFLSEVAEAVMPNVNFGYCPESEDLAKLRRAIARCRQTPYWPSNPELRRELAAIYDEKGIAHPDPNGPERRERTAESVRIHRLTEEQLAALREELSALDYSSDEDSKYEHFIAPEKFDIRGLGEHTLELLLDAGWLQRFGDIFRLKDHRDEIIASGLLSETKTDSVLASIETARQISDIRFLSALAIPGLGERAARSLLSVYTLREFMDTCLAQDDLYVFAVNKNVGGGISAAAVLWFENEANVEMLDDLLREVTIREESREEKGALCEGLTFVVTGDVHIYSKRQELKDYIISQGGELSGSVSKNTSFLINNDLDSPSAKNKKAHDLGVPIISEEQFIERFTKKE